MSEDIAALARVYDEFARKEAAGRSPLYELLCLEIAKDEALLSRVVALPVEKRQPNLLLAAVKYLFGVVEDWPQFRALVQDRWREIEPIIRTRRTQTNEPARCATLLPVLAGLPQPLALLEVGASAGLCLLPDYYGYRFNGRTVPPAHASAGFPVFDCACNDGVPIPTANVEVAWRMGLDLSPLDVCSNDDANWLRALVWPGEGRRAELLESALQIARRHSPEIVQGDLRTDLAGLIETAPEDATLVVFHTAVLAYVASPAERARFGKTVMTSRAHWLSNEGVADWGEAGLPPSPWGRFSLALDGKVLAHTDAHGKSVDWL
jgi:hypothetical protein